MEALGLFSHDLAAVAMRNKAEQAGAGAGKKPAKRKAQTEPTQPTRRSRRLDGTAASEAAAAAEEGEEGAPDDEHLASLHEAEAAAWSARHAGKQCRATVVGTASYNHTLMRCVSKTCRCGMELQFAFDGVPHGLNHLSPCPQRAHDVGGRPAAPRGRH